MQNFSMYMTNNIITAILKLFRDHNNQRWYYIVPNILFIICPTFRVKLVFSNEI